MGQLTQLFRLTPPEVRLLIPIPEIPPVPENRRADLACSANRFFQDPAAGPRGAWAWWMSLQTRSGWWCLTAARKPRVTFYNEITWLLRLGSACRHRSSVTAGPYRALSALHASPSCAEGIGPDRLTAVAQAAVRDATDGRRLLPTRSAPDGIKIW